MSVPYFSIVIPTYNRASQLARSIQSVLDQKEQNFELLIIDDGSTDNTEAVVSKFLSDPRVKYFYQENRERGAARNKGGAMAKGKYLNFFDSDDYMYTNHLLAASVFLKGGGEPDFIHTCYRVVDDKGQVLAEEQGEDSDHSADRLIETNYLSCDSVFVKRALFLETQFNEDRRLASAEDWELWLRIISRKDLHRCREITFEIRNHPGRSLFTIAAERIAERDTVLLESLLRDQAFVSKFSHKLALFKADLLAFSALVYSTNRHGKLKTIGLLWASLFSSIRVLGRKRFWAALKHLVIKPFW